MSFKHSCFIENTPEARGWLESIGYKKHFLDREDDPFLHTWISGGYSSLPIDSVWNPDHQGYCGDEYNCIGNLPLFKALTAVRDDSDYMQWFVCSFSVSDCTIPKGEFRLSTGMDFQTPQEDGSFWKKATKEEIVNHFNGFHHKSDV